MERPNLRVNYPKKITDLLMLYTDIQHDKVLTDYNKKILVTLVRSLLDYVNHEENTDNKCAGSIDIYLIMISPIGLELLKKNHKLRDVITLKLNELKEATYGDNNDPSCRYLYKFLDEVVNIFNLTFN